MKSFLPVSCCYVHSGILTLQIALEPLMCVRAEEQGRLLATGSKNGTITLLEVSDSLVNPQRDEKQAFNAVSLLTARFSSTAVLALCATY